MTLPAPRFALMTVAAVVTVIAVSAPHSGSAQVAAQSGPSKPAASSKTDHAAHSATQPSLADQLRKLQDKVARLEVALKQNHTGQSGQAGGMQGMSGMSSGPKMGMGGMKMGGGMMKGMSGKGMSGMGMQGMGMKGMGMMSGMGQNGGGMSDMSGMSGMGMKKGMSGMGMMGGGMKGMGMMGQQPGMGTMSMPTALPGYPGASHIYHIGSTAFFLDHPQHITLTTEQQTQLNGVKEQSLLKQDEFNRGLEAAEQQLWKLTSSDAPDVAKIDASVREIEKLRGDQRIAFIRSVGEAAGILTVEQRKVLVGQLPADHASSGGDADSHQH